MKSARIRWMLLILPLLTLLTATCDTSPTEDILAGEGDRLIDITLKNFDLIQTHLFSRGEDFPCCQVPPNFGRTITVLAQPGEAIEFRAGRNGVILDTVTCTVDDRQYPSLDRDLPGSGGDVEFLVTEELRCTGHWQ